jgi:hypothetical protein
MNQPIKTLQTENKILNIFIEEDAFNPREDDNLGTMICSHKRYNLGDEKQSKEFDFDEHNNWDEVEKALIKEHKTAIILPLYLYDHSGITMKTTPFSCRWDSGQVGFVYISKDKVRKEYNVKRIT